MYVDCPVRDASVVKPSGHDLHCDPGQHVRPWPDDGLAVPEGDVPNGGLAEAPVTVDERGVVEPAGRCASEVEGLADFADVLEVCQVAFVADDVEAQWTGWWFSRGGRAHKHVEFFRDGRGTELAYPRRDETTQRQVSRSRLDGAPEVTAHLVVWQVPAEQLVTGLAQARQMQVKTRAVPSRTCSAVKCA